MDCPEYGHPTRCGSPCSCLHVPQYTIIEPFPAAYIWAFRSSCSIAFAFAMFLSSASQLTDGDRVGGEVAPPVSYGAGTAEGSPGVLSLGDNKPYTFRHSEIIR